MEFDFQSFLNRKKLKQKEASDILGVSMGLVGSWAVGRGKPSYDTMLKLIDAGVTLYELFGKDKADKLLSNTNSVTTKPPTKEDLRAAVKEVMAEMIYSSDTPNI